MNTAVQPAKTLQERVGERIRDQIGDLLTDEDLKKLVDTALHEAFFTRTPIPKRHYNEDQTYADSFAVNHVKGLLKERVDVACRVWLGEHSDEIGKHIDNAVGKGFLVLFQQWLDQKVQQDLYTFGQSIKQTIGIGN